MPQQHTKRLYVINRIIEWSLYALVFCIPLSKTGIEICITVAFFAWISKKVLLRNFKLTYTPLNATLIAFCIVAALSIINADFKLLASKALVSKCLKYVILFFIIVENIDSEEKLKNLLKISIVSISIVMIDAYLQYYVLHQDLIRLHLSYKYRVTGSYLGLPTGPFSMPNDLSAWMLVFLIPAFTVFVWGTKKIGSKCLLGMIVVPFSFLFYLANTRSAWGAALTSLFLIFFVKAKKMSIILLILIIMITCVSFVFFHTEKHFGFRSMQDRLYMWRIGWKIFTEHPFMGNGINMFFGKFKELREDSYRGERGSYAHNGYLQMAAEIGVFGLMLFLLLLGKLFQGVFRHLQKAQDPFSSSLVLGLAGGLFAFLIHSFFDTNLQSLPLATLFWMNMAFLVSAQNIYASKV